MTRTTRIDLSTMTTAEDHLSSEGWKWEPTADGGTLTLRDFYMKASHKEKYAHALIQGKGNVVIVLEGENVIEFTPSKSGTFQYTCWMGMIRGNITVTDTLETSPTDPDTSTGAEETDPETEPFFNGSGMGCCGS